MKDLEKKIYKHLKDRHWHNLRPVDISKSIMIEGAELLENFQWDNHTLDEVRKNKEQLEDVKKELADVLIYCIELSVLLKFNTQKIIEEKLEYIGKKYPAKLMRETQSGFGAGEAYWKIKKEHRKKALGK